MWITNQGYIMVDHLPELPVQNAIKVLFNCNLVHNYVYFVKRDDDRFIEISDVPGDVEDLLAKLLVLLKENGVKVHSAFISYFGDYDGAYEYNPETEEFEELGEEEVAIRNVSTDALISELKKRMQDPNEDIWYAEFWKDEDIADNLPEDVENSPENIMIAKAILKDIFGTDLSSRHEAVFLALDARKGDFKKEEEG